MADGHAFQRDRHPSHEELGGYEGAKMGMWLFLATELLLFGVLFAAFTIFHIRFVEEFKIAHHSLNKIMGGTNTIILILSSVSAVLALDSIQRGKKKLCNIMLATTILFACGFLVVKYFEYSGKFHHQIFPGNAAYIHDPRLDSHGAEGAAPVDMSKTSPEGYIKVDDFIAREGLQGEAAAKMKQGINLFFTFYFVMTAIHGLHVLIGMTIIGILLYMNAKGRYSHWYYTPIENGTLYWHLVDLIWIYLFPLFYLVR